MTVTIETQFSETGQSEPWKNDVAKQLNLLLEWEHSWLSPKRRRAILSIVQRVADFEEITMLKDTD